ncbi:unnamed protein product [Vicia faba]|uniref:Uncharacterized protein n=1 Tax=Vicia faba TaxID=3906 RepID=A0AAV1B0P1_VICFA|nr:unnamed protein product [Vicia faba]
MEWELPFGNPVAGIKLRSPNKIQRVKPYVWAGLEIREQGSGDGTESADVGHLKGIATEQFVLLIYLFPTLLSGRLPRPQRVDSFDYGWGKRILAVVFIVSHNSTNKAKHG